jgi:hypothetical protein
MFPESTRSTLPYLSFITSTNLDTVCAVFTLNIIRTVHILNTLEWTNSTLDPWYNSTTRWVRTKMEKYRLKLFWKSLVSSEVFLWRGHFLCWYVRYTNSMTFTVLWNRHISELHVYYSTLFFQRQTPYHESYIVLSVFTVNKSKGLTGL